VIVTAGASTGTADPAAMTGARAASTGTADPAAMTDLPATGPLMTARSATAPRMASPRAVTTAGPVVTTAGPVVTTAGPVVTTAMTARSTLRVRPLVGRS
jgi:hypothetical protein